MIINKKELNDKLELSKSVITDNRVKIRSVNEAIGANSHKLLDVYDKYFYIVCNTGHYGLSKSLNVKRYISPIKEDTEDEKYFKTMEDIIDYINTEINKLKKENQILKMNNSKIAKSVLKLEVELEHKRKCNDYMNKDNGIIIEKLKTGKSKHKQKMSVRDWSRTSSIVSRMNKEDK